MVVRMGWWWGLTAGGGSRGLWGWIKFAPMHPACVGCAGVANLVEGQDTSVSGPPKGRWVHVVCSATAVHTVQIAGAGFEGMCRLCWPYLWSFESTEFVFDIVCYAKIVCSKHR